jgi:hypothetical protein
MSHLPQNLRLVSSGELTKTKSQNPTQGRQSKAEGNRRRWIRTLMQFLWTIFSVFVGKWILCFTSKVYMKNIVLDLWDDSSRIEFKEEYSNLMEEVKGVLNLTQVVWYGKKITRVKCNQSDLQETLSVPVIVTIKIYSKAHRRNNQIEFQWYVDIIRMITQIFTTPQKFWSLDQPLHPVP